MPIQLDFILRRLVEMVEADPALADRQPWKAAREKDAAGWARVLTDHYAGDDSKVQVLAGGILAAYAGISVEEFEQRSEAFLRSAQTRRSPRLPPTAYRPMVELLDLRGQRLHQLHRLGRRPRLHAARQPASSTASRGSG